MNNKMKNKLLGISLAILSSLLLATCKNPEIGYETFTIANDTVLAEVYSVSINGTYSFSGDVHAMYLKIGNDESLSESSSHPFEITDKAFSIRIDSLIPNTTYYYCYSVDFGWQEEYCTEIKSFTTLKGKPVVKTLEWTPISGNLISIKCEVTGDGGAAIIERGICWNTTGDHDPFNNNVRHNENGLGEYSCQIENPESSTTYFVRAYARNEMGTSYGNIIVFITSNGNLPTVITEEVTDIGLNTAIGHGNVISEGSDPVIDRGVCWSTENELPIINDSHAHSGQGMGSFAVEMTGLSPDVVYYVRAYATNNYGTAYGATVTFSINATLPTVITGDVTDIGMNSAVGHGNVIDEGSSSVTERGICWSSQHESPTIDNSDSYASSGQGLGSFAVTMNGLSNRFTYHARAYATNSFGTSYGETVTFRINATLPTVITGDVTDIGKTSAIGHGNVTDEGNSNVTERGICWSSEFDLPTIQNGFHLTDSGQGLGSFTLAMTGLTPGTTYYVRAYATNSHGTKYGNPKEFETLPSEIPIGAINGKFSVAENSYVFFAKGNLQYIGSASTPYWKFADNQWECLNSSSGQDSDLLTVDRDLFGWGTSGFPHGANCYQPWATSQNDTDYYAYGRPLLNLYEGSGEADWGYNAISNGGSQTNLWRTLTRDEWDYLFNSRPTISEMGDIVDARYLKAMVNNVPGVILFPDSYTHPNGVRIPEKVNYPDIPFDVNTYYGETWEELQNNGCVFLPAAGDRQGTTLYEPKYGCYWSTTYQNNNNAFDLLFKENDIETTNYSSRSIGKSIRLVYPIQ